MRHLRNIHQTPRPLPGILFMCAVFCSMSAYGSALDKFDKETSLWWYTLAQNYPYFEGLVTYGGLVAYELYVLPGMMLAIMYAAIRNESQSLRFHVLPHVFAYSVVGLIKHAASRERPGCVMEAMRGFESHHKCNKGFKTLSFPSGHSCVAFSVATGLAMYLFDGSETKWRGWEDSSFAVKGVCGMASVYCGYVMVSHMWQCRTAGRPIDPWTVVQRILKQAVIGAAVCALMGFIGFFDYNGLYAQWVTALFAYGVAVLTALHRIAKGYHHVLDSVVGALLGAACGVFVYSMLGADKGQVGASQYVMGLIGAWYIWYFFSYTTKCVAAKPLRGDGLGGCTLHPLHMVEH